MNEMQEQVGTIPTIKIPTVTSLEQLKDYSSGTIVELPPFSEGQPFFARLKRPSMMKMVKEGKIPNALLTSANKLFSNGADAFNENDEHAMDNLFQILDAVCASTFVEPRFEDMKSAGIELTDEQYMFIFSYVQSGVKSLESFR